MSQYTGCPEGQQEYAGQCYCSDWSMPDSWGNCPMPSYDMLDCPSDQYGFAGECWCINTNQPADMWGNCMENTDDSYNYYYSEEENNYNVNCGYGEYEYMGMCYEICP